MRQKQNPERFHSPAPPPVTARWTDVLREVALARPLVEEEPPVLDSALLEPSEPLLPALEVETAATSEGRVPPVLLATARRGQTARLRGVLRPVTPARDGAEDASRRARAVADHYASGALDVVAAVALFVRIEARRLAFARVGQQTARLRDQLGGDNAFLGQRVETAEVAGEVPDELVLAAFEIIRAAAEGVSVESVLTVRTAGVLAFTARGRGAIEELAADGHGVKDGA